MERESKAVDEIEEIEEREEISSNYAVSAKQNKSIMMQYFPLFAQMMTVYGSLKLSKLLIQAMQLPFKNLQVCMLSSFALYGSQKMFDAFKWDWTLLLFMKLFCEITVNALPEKLKLLSVKNTVWLISSYWSYQLTFAAPYCSRSYLSFYKSCYGFGAKDKNVRVFPDALTKYHEEMRHNPSTTTCCDSFHPNTASCARNTIRRTVYHFRCIFKWYFKFYLAVFVLFASPSIIKKISFLKLIEIIKKSATSAIRSATTNTIMVVINYFVGPCVSQYILRKYFPTDITFRKQRILTVFFILFSCRIVCDLEPMSRKTPLIIFSLCQIVQHRINKLYGINNCDDMKRGKGSDCFVRDNNFTSGFVAVYMLMAMVFCWWSMKRNKRLKGFDTKIFQQFLFT